jgi:hypothetical protein
MKITKSSSIEDIINANTGFIDYLSNQGIRCIRCGEPIFGTFEEAALQKGYEEEQILHFVDEMNLILSGIKGS